MKRIILSHSGKQHSYNVADALNNLGVLKNFYTSSYIGNRFFQGIIQKQRNSFLTKRFLYGLCSPKVKANWRFEMKELLYRRLGVKGDKFNQLVYERDEAFDKFIARNLKKLSYDIFWGFQGSCLLSLNTAKSFGKSTVCEMTIAHLPFAKKILEEEAILQPEWKETIDFTSFPSKYENRLITEPHEAEYVIAISSFLKKTLVLDGIDPGKVTVLPLGFDSKAVRFDKETISIENRPLRVLYAGRITQRKGLSYLLDAMKDFNKKDVELHVIGNIHGNGEVFKKNKHLYEYRSGLSQKELFSKYTEYDVLVFPSILEGFGLVSVEAMGAGLPVITTPNTNAAEILKDGVNGYLIPIRDSNAIKNAIGKIRGMDNAQFQEMRWNARETALQFTWDAYKNNLQHFVQTIKVR